jgi:hypothetical protein
MKRWEIIKNFMIGQEPATSHCSNGWIKWWICANRQAFVGVTDQMQNGMNYAA